MKVTLCKDCGHPIVGDDLNASLTPLQRRIFDAVKRSGSAGIGSRDIMDIVYADDINGGPDDTNIIAVVIKQMAPRLARFNLKITGSRGPGAVFTLAALDLPKIDLCIGEGLSEEVVSQLCKIRQDKKITQEAMATLMDKGASGYASLLENRKRNPTLSTLALWADSLGYKIALEPKV